MSSSSSVNYIRIEYVGYFRKYFNPWRSKAYYNLRVTLGAFTNTNMKSHDKFAAFNADFISGKEMTVFVPLNLENQTCFYERTLNQSYFIEFIFETIQMPSRDRFKCQLFDLSSLMS